MQGPGVRRGATRSRCPRLQDGAVCAASRAWSRCQVLSARACRPPAPPARAGPKGGRRGRRPLAGDVGFTRTLAGRRWPSVRTPVPAAAPPRPAKASRPVLQQRLRERRALGHRAPAGPCPGAPQLCPPLRSRRRPLRSFACLRQGREEVAAGFVPDAPGFGSGAWGASRSLAVTRIWFPRLARGLGSGGQDPSFVFHPRTSQRRLRKRRARRSPRRAAFPGPLFQSEPGPPARPPPAPGNPLRPRGFVTGP